MYCICSLCVLCGDISHSPSSNMPTLYCVSFSIFVHDYAAVVIYTLSAIFIHRYRLPSRQSHFVLKAKCNDYRRLNFMWNIFHISHKSRIYTCIIIWMDNYLNPASTHTHTSLEYTAIAWHGLTRLNSSQCFWSGIFLAISKLCPFNMCVSLFFFLWFRFL